MFTEYRDTLARLASELQDLQPCDAAWRSHLPSVESICAASRVGAARLLLATDAASEGLNLQQRCRLVINLELPWTPRGSSSESAASSASGNRGAFTPCTSLLPARPKSH